MSLSQGNRQIRPHLQSLLGNRTDKSGITNFVKILVKFCEGMISPLVMQCFATLFTLRGAKYNKDYCLQSGTISPSSSSRRHRHNEVKYTETSNVRRSDKQLQPLRVFFPICSSANSFSGTGKQWKSFIYMNGSELRLWLHATNTINHSELL